MPDFYFKFMKPDIWDALVIASIFIGLAFAILRLMRDRATYQYHQRRLAQQAERSSSSPSDSRSTGSDSSPKS